MRRFPIVKKVIKEEVNFHLDKGFDDERAHIG